MKKTIILSIALVCFALGTSLSINSKTKRNMNSLASANFEALADTECPDFNYVPNRFLEAELVDRTFTANASGEITIGGITHNGFKANVTVTISVVMRNCSGQETGACCDQRNIGISWS